MSISKLLFAAILVTGAGMALAEGPGLGQPLATDEIPFYATYVMPDGRGLPAGSGTATKGAEIYASRCAACHGETGTEGPVMPPRRTQQGLGQACGQVLAVRHHAL